jgi:diguanylate cyclase (GGDEF)-like protein
MIVRHADLRSVLRALCMQSSAVQSERQIAIFLFEKGRWELAATGDLSAESERLLAGVVPEELSETLFAESPEPEDAPCACMGSFRGRHLFSGLGEMLGLLLCLDSNSRVATDILCRLASLAIEQRNLLEELTWQADHDAVTGLSTRTRFERALTSRLRSGGDSTAALLCLNLDRFRLINAVLGHSFGNRVLKSVGIRFQSCLGPGSLLARVGGDEFAVLTSGELAVTEAERMVISLSEPFSIDEHQLFLGVSIGLSRARPGITPELLQREAYIALYHAKRAGKGQWLAFHPTMAAVPPERLEMEMCLRSALANHEMELHYQPQIDLTSGRLSGAEALLRWNPAGLGRISPSAFIPILEETGLIFEVGEWVLREACRQGLEWRSAGHPLRLAVNVSAIQFLSPGFAELVEGVLAETGYPPALLELELTESLFIDDFPRARTVFRRLQKLGIPFALDDFGTGQSSFSYLRELPFQRLKIDRAFVVPIADGDNCAPIVENIVHLGAGMGMITVAEGIDHPDQLVILRAMGCDEGQGFLLSQPLTSQEFFQSWLSKSERTIEPDAPVSDTPQETYTHRGGIPAHSLIPTLDSYQ